MTELLEISPELTGWALRAGFRFSPESNEGPAVFWSNGGEIRYFIRGDEQGWLTVATSERMGREQIEFVAADASVLERYLFGWFGEDIRSSLGLPAATAASRQDPLRDGFDIVSTTYDGADHLGLRDMRGRLLAIDGFDSFLAPARLARLAVYLTSSIDEITESFLSPDGKPILNLREPVLPASGNLREDRSDRASGSDDDFMRQFAEGFQDAGGASAAADFTVVDDAPATLAAADRDEQIHSQASAMADRIAQELAYLGPSGWQELNAVFALTVRAAAAQLRFATQNGAVSLRVPDSIVDMVREQRALSAQMSAGPWWRLILTVTNQGLLTVSYDYGEDPFPEDQLQPAGNYRDDVAAYPRPPLPVWLAGYIAGPAAQGRSPQQAAAAADSDRAARRMPTKTDDIEPLSDTWARWAVLAAIHVGARSPWGPRMSPGVAWYESDARSGSTLAVLPGNRAVLSGGLWNSPLLAAAYQRGQQLPDLYAGAPPWVNDSVLNTRNQNGLLSFCYWWSDGGWWRGGTNTFDELDEPVPQIWTPRETVEKVVEVIGPGTEQAALQLIEAASTFAATKEQLESVFSRVPDADIDAAYSQLVVAGLAQ